MITGPLAGPTLPARTWGGKQFWSDVLFQGGWRVQKNQCTGHCRLLDPDDRRRYRGSFSDCKYHLTSMVEATRSTGDSVVLLHGLLRSRDSMRAIASRLDGEGYEVLNLNYPSGCGSLRSHAAQITGLLGRLPSRRISFVTHSMGAIVARLAFARFASWKQDHRFRRMVMIAPPNRGSRIAEFLSPFPPYRWLYGPAGTQIQPERIRDLPPPPVPFGVIAGGTGGRLGFNPLLEGDNDGTLRVETTRLQGAESFRLVTNHHSLLPLDRRVIESVVQFLERGRFARED